MRYFLIGGGLFGILALSLYFAVITWIDLGDVSLGWFGWVTMVVGSLLALGLGGGLMALVFYSARRGHDDAHHDQGAFRLTSFENEPEPDPDPTDGPDERASRRKNDDA